MAKKYSIDQDIAKAETLPSTFYKDEEVFIELQEQVFAKSWQFIGDFASLLPLDGYVYPFMFLENHLEEPLLLVRSKTGDVHCLSNVCTHRANLIAFNSGKVNSLTCLYHGRRFDFDGTFRFMPEFEHTKNFPRPCDHLRKFPLQKLGPFAFTALDPIFDFDTVIEYMQQWIGFLPLEEYKLDRSKSRDYLVNCHWALYCDNYLEGFHIPFVHPELNGILDYGTYTTELFEHGSLQIGYADGAEEVFSLPENHPSNGKEVAAFYFWIFPNMMFNFYPWGLSINVVKPISRTKTKVSFITYLHNENKFDEKTIGLIDKVEREDEFVVEGVFKGLQSRFYQTGRFSPTREQGVHHFHRMLAKSISRSV